VLALFDQLGAGESACRFTSTSTERRATMLRSVLAFLAISIFTGGLLAAEAIVVSFSPPDKQAKAPAKVVVKVGEKEQSIELAKGIKVTDADGNQVKKKKLANVLNKDTKIELTETDGKVTEIKIKK
jgi:methionine-rich copper-binding protein CopC